MSNHNQPSIDGGPMYGRPSFDAAMFEDIYGATIAPAHISGDGSPGLTLTSYKGRPFNTAIVSFYRLYQVPTVASYSVPTGILFRREHALGPSFGYDDFINAIVDVSNNAPGGFIRYRYALTSQRLGDIFIGPWIDTGSTELSIMLQLRFGSGADGHVTFNYLAYISDGVSETMYDNWVFNYGYDGQLFDRPDNWYTIFYGGYDPWLTTSIDMLIFDTVSRLTNVGAIASSQLFGTLSLVQSINIAPSSIVSQEVFGVPLVSQSGTNVAQFETEPETEGDMRLTMDDTVGYVDISLADRDVERDAGFETAVLLTIGTDRRAENDDILPDKSEYRGGWFGDVAPTIPNDKAGCRLWLLRRAKTEAEILPRAREYLLDGFKWMLDDGIVKKIDIQVDRAHDLRTTMLIRIAFYRPEVKPIFYQFYYNWQAQDLRRS